MQLPPDLEKLVVLLDWPLPDFEELQSIVDRAVQDLDDPQIVHLNGDAEDLIKAMSGLTAFEARMCSLQPSSQRANWPPAPFR